MTTLGRGGSDLTATTIGKGLGLREIQVGKNLKIKRKRDLLCVLIDMNVF